MNALTAARGSSVILSAIAAHGLLGLIVVGTIVVGTEMVKICITQANFRWLRNDPQRVNNDVAIRSLTPVQIVYKQTITTSDGTAPPTRSPSRSKGSGQHRRPREDRVRRSARLPPRRGQTAI